MWYPDESSVGRSTFTPGSLLSAVCRAPTEMLYASGDVVAGDPPVGVCEPSPAGLSSVTTTLGVGLPRAFLRMLSSCWIAPAGFVMIAWIFVAMFDATSSSCERLWLISGSCAFRTSATGPVPWERPLTNWMIRSSACVIELKSRFWKRERMSWKFGPVKCTSGVGKCWNQSSLVALTIRSAETPASVSPDRTPPGAMWRSPPKPPESVPLKKPVFGASALPLAASSEL